MNFSSNISDMSLEQFDAMMAAQSQATNRNIFHNIAAMNQVKLMKEILEKNKNPDTVEPKYQINATTINHKDKFGQTPLYIAIFGFNTPIFDLMISEIPQIDVQAHDHQRISMLHLCAVRGYYEMAEKILQKVPPEDKQDFINSYTLQENTALSFVQDNHVNNPELVEKFTKLFQH